MTWKYIDFFQDYKNVSHKIPEEVLNSKNAAQIQRYANIEKHNDQMEIMPTGLVCK